MVTKIGQAVGTCPRCRRQIHRPRPIDLAVCECYLYCPNDHGNGEYGTEMESYSPDFTPNTYGPITDPEATGQTKHPLRVLFVCPVCKYHSDQKPVEVPLV